MKNGPERHAHFKTMADLIKEDVPGIVIYNPIVFGLLSALDWQYEAEHDGGPSTQVYLHR